MENEGFDLENFGSLCQALGEKDKEGIDKFAPKVFQDIDKNNNGLLEREEIMAFASLISNDAE